MFLSVNPYTEKKIGQTRGLTDKKLQEKLHLSDQSFLSWHLISLNTKKDMVLTLKALLGKDIHVRAGRISREMGKPLKQSLAEIRKCQSLCEWSVNRVEEALKDRTKLRLAPPGAQTCYQPLGVILGIMPWNFPYWQVFRFAVTALFGGNTVLIKHAPNVMECAKDLEALFLSAGFPEGVYQNIPISEEQTQKLIAHPTVKGVSLTGSVKAGSVVAGLAGRWIKKCVLELGGSDPYLVLESADLKLASKHCVSSRMNNSGQSCIAAKRWIVHKHCFPDFMKLVQDKLNQMKQGDPLSLKTTLGPLARKDLRNLLHKQVCSLMNKKGARLILGGKIPKRKGYFYPPTLIHIPSGLEIKEEFFGPVALIISVSDDDEAIQVANRSPYGLGGAIFSGDVKRAKWMAKYQLQTGACAINGELHSHPALPFGGIKNSGVGRELSDQGFHTFMNLKTLL